MTEKDHPINLVVVRHKHLTRDPPPWVSYVWRARMGIIMVCACWVGMTDLPTGVGILIALALTFVLARVVLPRYRWLSATSERPKNGTAVSVADDERLLCYGDPVELEALREIEVELFEPIILRVSPVGSGKAALGAIIGGLLILTLGRLLVKADHVSVTAGLLVCVMVLPALCFMFPRYYRVVPGRLDFIRYGFFSSKPSRVEACSLTGARVTCRFHEQSLTIRGPGLEELGATGSDFVQEGSPLSVDLTRVLEPHKLAYAVFLAALYARPCPLVPTDALVG